MFVSPSLTDYASQWDNDDIKILENFFENKVASQPYKVNPAHAFCKLITAPFRVLRDCIHIMKLEMVSISLFVPFRATSHVS